MKNYLLLGLFICVLFSGCNSLKSVKQVLLNTSPYDEYAQSLGKAGLKESVLAKQWMNAGEQVFKDSITVNLPFVETGFFKSTVPQANGYRFHLYAGQLLTVNGVFKSNPSAHVFADLFVWKNDRWEFLMHADTALHLTYEFDKECICLLRIQPELLSDVWYSLGISCQPALINPVKGATNKSIGSFYGNTRDEGKRTHEGVDIFAAKGTPVIAPADGIIYNVGTNNLGGKVIWLYDLKRGQNYYFAHLDSQWVGLRMDVKQGDTLGQVGNTGNARKTAPHLHFGIYRNGSLDPLYYIQTTSSISTLPLDTSFHSSAYKVSANELSLHASPELKSKVLYKISKDTYVQPIARSKNWSRVVLPDKRQAFVQTHDIGPLGKGKSFVLKKTDTLWSDASIHAVPIMNLAASEVVVLLAHYDQYHYIRTSQQHYGWIKL